MPEAIFEQLVVPEELTNASHTGDGISLHHYAVLEKASHVLATARKETYRPMLRSHDIDTDCLDRLEVELEICHARLARVEEATGDLRMAAETARQAERQFLTVLEEIQAAARQKYRYEQPPRKWDYLVGEKVGSGRDAILRVSEVVLTWLETDQLPGIGPAKVAALRTLRNFYLGATITQIDLQQEARVACDAVHSSLASITAQRVKIQLAAEAQWPPAHKASAAPRQEFLLPVGNRFRG